MFPDQLDRATILEMTRLQSINRQSELVVCTHFLPWMDLALSADSEGEFPPVDPRNPVELRWLELADFISKANETLLSYSWECRALTSFGLVRCWHVFARQRYIRGYGPIMHMVDGGRWLQRMGWPA